MEAHFSLFMMLKKQFQPRLMMFTTRTRCSSGTTEKLATWTAGHTMQFALYPGSQHFFSFSTGSVPSMMAMDDRNMNMFVGAKMV